MQNTVIVSEASSRAPRRSYTKAFKADIVAQCERGDRSLAQVAMEHQINANLVRKWQHQLRDEINAQKLVPVHVDSTPTTTASLNYIEIELGALAIKVHGRVDAVYLASVIDSLR